MFLDSEILRVTLYRLMDKLVVPNVCGGAFCTSQPRHLVGDCGGSERSPPGWLGAV